MFIFHNRYYHQDNLLSNTLNAGKLHINRIEKLGKLYHQVSVVGNKKFFNRKIISASMELMLNTSGITLGLVNVIITNQIPRL